MSSEYLPPLRFELQLSPVDYEGERMFALQDSSHLIEGVVLLPRDVLPLLVLFDGAHTYNDLQQVMMRREGNRLVATAEVEAFIDELDGMLLLQTVQFENYLAQVRGKFAAMTDRLPALAGTAYPEEAEQLAQAIDDIVALSENGTVPGSGCPKVLIAPHIDLRIGADVYAAAYSAVAGCKPQRIIMLGTGHSLDDGLFSFTEKSYSTPLGTNPTDIAAMRELRNAADVAGSPDDFAHRSEHSLEFQTLFIQRLFGSDVALVPVLVGSFAQFIPDVDDTQQLDEVQAFCRRLNELADDNTLIVAGVDFCHVGPKFGHPEPAAVYEEKFRAHDKALIAALSEGSLADFWDESRRVGDGYHVCGLGALICLLQAFPGLHGKLLGYEVWHEQPTQSAISFAAMMLS